MMSASNARTILNRFVLERPIARHGLEETWAAFDRRIDRLVAINLLPGDTIRAPGVMAAAARVQSPHVEPIHEHGRDEDGNEFFATDLLEGEYLDVRLCTLGKLPLPAVAMVVTDVAEGLNALHSAGIVHNSVKPARIFLAQTAQGDMARITYGICLVEWSGSDVTSRVGTPAYMSPEQAELGAISPRSDQWALAVTAYEALTGQLPFLGSMNDGKLIAEICTGTPPPPSHVVPGIDTEVDRFFECALAKDPALRFPSLPEMAAAFAALTGGATR